ncbi:MAG: exonuclease domain-containing protein [Xanthobacteraceae bacterium]
MRAGVAIAIILGALSLVAFTLAGIAVWQGAGDRATLGAFLSVAFVIVLALAAIAFGLFSTRLLRPLTHLRSELSMRAQTRVDRPIEVAPGHWLEGLPGAAEALRKALQTARSETEGVVTAATRRAEEQKSHLEAILLDLSEGVIVCNLAHRILLYNQAAVRILGAPDALGLDRSLFALLTPEPILHTLELLQADDDLKGADSDAVSASRGSAGDGVTRRLVCGTVDRESLLQARLGLVHESSGAVSGYVLTFADVGGDLESLAQREKLLREVTQEWRRPLASLTAAAEMLGEHESLSADERAQLETVVGKEVRAINQHFEELTRRYDRLAAGSWPLADIHSVDLFQVVSRHLAERDGLVVTPVGVPVWVFADSHLLMLALEHVIRAIADYTGNRAFDLGVVPGRAHGYVEVTWSGDAIPSTVVEAWLVEPLPGAVGNRTLRDMIEQHGSELWSQTLPEGRACLRLPLRAVERAAHPAPAGERTERVPPWSEFYDFDLFRGSSEAFNEAPLRKLTFVVFDSEATGLRPNEGDELVSIGAVRVVNGRVLSGETFDRLINPGRSIPAATTRIHGITADMVRDKPPAPVVIAQFKGFVGDAVLVAYNAAFDMAFLHRGAKAAGIAFGNPVLDALLLSVYLQDDISDFSLTAAAGRMGIEVVGRHTALGDAMVTAAIFVKLLDLLEAREITTFGQALRISKWMMEQRRQEADLK